MTIPNENIENNYVGNGVATTFAYTFPIFEDADIVVTRADTDGVETVLTLNTDYTVTGAGLSTGGNVVLSSALASNYLLNVTSNTAKTQTYDIRSNPTYRPDNMERALDRQVRMIQEVGHKSVRLAVTQTGVDPRLPLADAGKIIGWKEDGTGLDNFSQIPEASIGSAMSAVMTASTLANARALMGPWDDALVTATGGSAARSLANRFADEVNVRDYGAVGDGVTDDTAAFTAAIATGRMVFAPAGHYRISQIVFGVSARGLVGAGGYATRLSPIGTITAYTPIIWLSNASKCEIRGLHITVNKATYPNNQAIGIYSSNQIRLADLAIEQGGFVGIVTAGSSQVDIFGCSVFNFVAWGIYCETSPLSHRIINCKVCGPGGSHCIQINGGTDHVIQGCDARYATATTFPISLLSVRNALVSGNFTVTNTVEGINCQDCTHVSVIGNRVFCEAGHTDFGMSFYSTGVSYPNVTQHVLVSGNAVYLPGKSGIAVAGGKSCIIKGNYVVSPNQLNEAMGSGLLVYGSQASGNYLSDNECVDEGSTMKYIANEWNDGGGNPGLTTMRDNFGSGGGLTGMHNIIGAGSRAYDIQAVAFVPTVSAATGSITTASATGQFLRRGKQVFIDIIATITANGTGAGAIYLSLPVSAASGQVSGRESGVSGVVVTGDCVAGTMIVRTYNNGYPGSSGAIIKLTGIYEST